MGAAQVCKEGELGPYRKQNIEDLPTLGEIKSPSIQAGWLSILAYVKNVSFGLVTYQAKGLKSRNRRKDFTIIYSIYHVIISYHIPTMDISSPGYGLLHKNLMEINSSRTSKVCLLASCRKMQLRYLCPSIQLARFLSCMVGRAIAAPRHK